MVQYGGVEVVDLPRQRRKKPLVIAGAALALSLALVTLAYGASQLTEETVEPTDVLLSAPRTQKLGLMDSEDRLIADAYGLPYHPVRNVQASASLSAATDADVSAYHNYPTYATSDYDEEADTAPVPLMENQRVGKYTYRIDPASRMEAEANVLQRLPIQADPADVAQQALKIAMEALGQSSSQDSGSSSSSSSSGAASSSSSGGAASAASSSNSGGASSASSSGSSGAGSGSSVSSSVAPPPAPPVVSQQPLREPSEEYANPLTGGVSPVLSRQSGVVVHSDPDSDFFGDDILRLFEPNAAAPQKSAASASAPAAPLAAPQQQQQQAAPVAGVSGNLGVAVKEDENPPVLPRAKGSHMEFQAKGDSPLSGWHSTRSDGGIFGDSFVPVGQLDPIIGG